LILFPIAFAFGIFLTVSPDFVGNLGFTYRGAFNAIIVVSSISARLVAGRASDRYGRMPLLIIGSLLLVAGMITISFAETPAMAALGGVLYGLSSGISMPTIFAWTIDFAKKGKTALALGTMLMSLEIGIGLGAVISGWYYGGDPERLPDTYVMAAIAGGSVVGMLLLFRRLPAFSRNNGQITEG
jgi:MFS family permease